MMTYKELKQADLGDLKHKVANHKQLGISFDEVMLIMMEINLRSGFYELYPNEKIALDKEIRQKLELVNKAVSEVSGSEPL